jgi:autotransporter-associated beta strand protein
LARDTAYYVVNAGTDTFQLATTPGGAPVTVSGKNFLTSGITLASGNNLETYGLLSATANANLVVGRGTAGGTVSTPTGGGNLYLTTGAAGMVIDAPITDNGGAVTVVRNGGAGRLVLSGNNTFTGGLVVNGGGAGAGVLLSGTQSFTGGITLNGGGLGDHSNSLPGVTNAALNGNAITVNGAAHLIVTNGQTLGTGNTITINSAGALSLGSSGTVTVSGVVSGSGLLDLGANSLNGSSTVNLTNTANTFTGNVIFANQHGGTLTLNAASLGDNGKVTFGLGNSANTQVFALHSDANATVNFNTRQFELAGTASTVSRIANNSAQAFNISTDLLTSGTGTRTLQLYGTGAGVSTFAGDIANGSLTSLGIAKAESGTWALSGDNTYTGDTAVSAGTLLVNNTTGSGTGAGNVSVSAGTIGGTGSISGNVTIGNSTGSADSILAPGTGIGSLATGNLAFNSDGRYAVELNGTSVTTDVTNVTGTVTIDPAATLTVNVAGTLSAGQQFVIVANDGVDPVSGTFAGLAEGDVAGTDGVTDLKISYTGGTGNDIVLYTDGVPGGDDYSTWATANGIDGEAFGDDFDNDGISNGVEYALGLDPTTSSQPAGVLSGNTITFTKGSDAITNADVSWIIETSTTLEVGSWTDEVTQAAGDASATISYTFTPGTPAKKFARLKVVQVP